MSKMQWTPEVLHSGAQSSAAASDAASDVAGTLSGASGSSNAFGNVGPAGALHGAVSTAQQAHAKGANIASANREVRSERTVKTVDIGDENIAATTTIASSAQSRQIAGGM